MTTNDIKGLNAQLAEKFRPYHFIPAFKYSAYNLFND